MLKRTIVAATATAAAIALPAAATAAVPSSAAHRYQTDYHAVAHKFGPRAPGRNIIESGLAGGKRANSSAVMRSIVVLERMLHPVPVLHVTYKPAPAPAPAALAAPSTSSAPRTTSPAPRTTSPAPAAPTATSSGGYSSVPGVPAGFAACVATRESSNGAGSSNIYGIIPASGYSVAGMSVAQQKQVFSHLYAKVGTSGWSPYDGC